MSKYLRVMEGNALNVDGFEIEIGKVVIADKLYPNAYNKIEI